MKIFKNIKPSNYIIPLLCLFTFISFTVFGQNPFEELNNQNFLLDGDEEFYDFKLINFDDDFFLRLVVNVIAMIILVRFIYYKVYGRGDFFFTFFMFNLVIFIITFLLNSNTGFSIGAAFGLFAIFSMLRYRTENISTRDMTYLFLSITIGLISAINTGTLIELVLINIVMVFGTFLLEGNVLIKPEFSKTVEYDKIDLITPDKLEELKEDLSTRTGLKIHKVNIRKINFIRKSVSLRIYYYNEKNNKVKDK